MELSFYSLIGPFQTHADQENGKSRKQQDAEKKSDVPHSTDQESVEHSEESSMNKKEGYNEVREDQPVNPDEAQKRKAKRGA